MKVTVPASSCIVADDFPYTGNGWGCDSSNRDLLDRLLYTIDDPDVPQGMSVVMDIAGMTAWYDEVADAEERELYECPTVYDYIACEIGRYVTPLKEVTL